MVQEETVSKKAQKNLEIASFNIPHTILVGEISLACVLGSNFLAKMVAKVDFKVKKMCLYQGDKTGIAPKQEETCNQEEKKKKLKSKKLSFKVFND